jgi:hypothetical protein
MLAYIPSIILIVWLLIEVRKFVVVRNDLRQTEAAWDKLERHRQKQEVKEKSIESTSPPPQDYYSEEQRDQYGYDYATDDYPAPPPSRSRQQKKSRGGKALSRSRKDSGQRGRRRMPPPDRARRRGASRRSKKKPLAGYDEEFGYTAEGYDDDLEDVDWD